MDDEVRTFEIVVEFLYSIDNGVTLQLLNLPISFGGGEGFGYKLDGSELSVDYL